MYISSFPALYAAGYLPRGGYVAEVQVVIHLCFDDLLFVQLEPIHLDVSYRLKIFAAILKLKLS